MDSSKNAFWVRFYSLWNGNFTVHRFDQYDEAVHFAKQVKGEIYDYYYKVVANFGFVNVGGICK